MTPHSAASGSPEQCRQRPHHHAGDQAHGRSDQHVPAELGSDCRAAGQQDPRGGPLFQGFELAPDVVDLEQPQHDVDEHHQPECERRVEACGNPLHVTDQPGAHRNGPTMTQPRQCRGSPAKPSPAHREAEIAPTSAISDRPTRPKPQVTSEMKIVNTTRYHEDDDRQRNKLRQESTADGSAAATRWQ